VRYQPNVSTFPAVSENYQNREITNEFVIELFCILEHPKR